MEIHRMVFILLLAAVMDVGIANSRGCSMADKPSDIVFLVDKSGSVNATNFQIQMKFVEDFVSIFSIGPSKIQVGLITFSSDVVPEFSLNTCSDLNCTLSEIRRVSYKLPLLTATDEALDFVRTKAFISKNGDRPGVPNILIILTDGISNDPGATAIAAKKIKAAGITVFAVGIGAAVDNKELSNIASSPQYVSNVNAFTKLSSIQDLLRNKTCHAIKNGGSLMTSLKTTLPTTTTTRKKPHSPSSTLLKAITIAVTTTRGRKHVIGKVPTINKLPGNQGTSTVPNSKNTKESGGDEFRLPEWFSYLEIAWIATVAVVSAGAMICCCVKFYACKRWKDDDEDEKVDRGKQWRSKLNARRPQAKPRSFTK